MYPAHTDQLRGDCSCSGRGADSSQKTGLIPVVCSDHQMAILTRGQPLDENSLTTLVNSFRLPLPATTAVPGLNVLHDNFDKRIGLAPDRPSTTDQVGNVDGFSSTETADVDVSAVINMVSGDSDTLFHFSTSHSLEHREAVGGMDLTQKPAVRTRKQPKQKQGLNGTPQLSHPPGLEGVVAAPICLLCGKHLSGCRRSFCRRCDSEVYGESQDTWNADL